MTDYYKLIQEKKREQSELDKRMQADADLLYLIPFILKDSAGKAVPDIVNITLNRPAVFGANVVASLGNAKQQGVVESDDKKIDTHEIESFLDAAFSTADRKLLKAKLPLLNPFADVQFCFRGRTARRVILTQKNGQTFIDIMPWDGRYVYELPDTAMGYETLRTKAEIEKDYGEEVALKVSGVKDIPVIDVWAKTHNEVWVQNFKVLEQGHSFGFTPVVSQAVLLGYGPALLDKNWKKHEGESIFFMIRDIVPELNRLASILQTLNMNEIKRALQYNNPDGSPQDEPPDRPRMGDMVSVGKGGIEPINMGEARLAAQMLYNIMEKAFQEGSYTDIDIGNVQQPFSAVALVTIGENKDMVYMPRLAAKELLNVATAEMLVQQALLMGGSVELGAPGHKKSFSTTKLQGEYGINYKYFVKSPKIDIARMSVAEAAAKWYPRSYIYSDVLQVEDPEGMMREWSRQEAAQISLGVKMHRIIMDLLEQAETNNDEEAAREAQIMALELGLTLEQVKAGQIQPQLPEPETTEPMLPLLGEGGQIGGLSPSKVASNLQKTPQAEKTIKGG